MYQAFAFSQMLELFSTTDWRTESIVV